MFKIELGCDDMVKPVRKFKKNFLTVVFCLSLLVVCIFVMVYLNDIRNATLEEVRKKDEEALIKEISNKYSQFVKIEDGSVLCKKDGKGYVDALKIRAGNDKSYSLDEIKIDKDTKYFHIKDLDLYVRYQDVIGIETLQEKDLRYQNYLPFNENVVTKENVRLYQNNELVYELYFSLDTPIIVKDNAGYYIEYNQELFFVMNEDISDVYAKENTTLTESTSIPVTVYHFIYLEGDNTCGESICHSEKQIRSHFNYLRENNFFTLNTTELGKFIDGQIRLPEKSILVTIDDGARAWNFVPLLEEYKVNATLFLISSWYDTKQFESPYMEIASHTDNLHTPGVCPGGQGSPLKCMDKESLLADLKTSRDKLNGTKALCFPFYEYNDYAISVVQEAGFEMAFIGGNRNVTRGIDKFKIPRVALTGSTTLQQYANRIN